MRKTRTRAVIDAEKARKRLKDHKAAKPKQIMPKNANGTPYVLNKMKNLGFRTLEETYYTRKGMTLHQLISSTPQLFKNNAVDVEAYKWRKTRTKGGKPVVQGVMWTNDPWRPKRTRRYHETYVIGLDADKDKPVHKHKKVLVQCTCESFVYTYEYANAKRGASYLIYSNGDPPVWMNPRMVPGMCKHLIALSKIILEEKL